MVGGANKKANSRETQKETHFKINESSTRAETDKDDIEEATEKGKGRGTLLKQGKKDSVQAKKQKKTQAENVEDEEINDEEDAEQDEKGDDDDEEEESEEVESIAQRKGKRSVKQKFVITKGTRVQLKEDKDMEEKLSANKKVKGKKQNKSVPIEIVSKPSKQIHKEKDDNIPSVAETPIKKKAESEKDQLIAAKPLPASSKKKEKIEIKAEEKLKKLSVAKELFDDSQIQQESQKLEKNISDNDKVAKNKKKKKDNLEVMLEKKKTELNKIEKKAAKKESMLEQVLKKIEQIKKEQQQGKSALSVLHSQCVNELFEEGSTGSLAKDKQQSEDGKLNGKLNEGKLDKQRRLDQEGDDEDHDDGDDDNNEDDDDEEEEESVQEIRKSNRRPAKPKQYADYDYQQKNKGNNKNNKAAVLEELQNEAEQLKEAIIEIKSRVSSQGEEIAMIQQNLTTQILDNSGTPPQSPQISNVDVSSTLPNISQNLPTKYGKKAGIAEKLNSMIAEESSQNIEIQNVADNLEESILGSQKYSEVIDSMKVPKKRGRKPKNGGSSEQNGQENSGEKDKLGRNNYSQQNTENLNLLNLFIQEAQKIQKNPTHEKGTGSIAESAQSLALIPDGEVAQNEKEDLRKKNRSHTQNSGMIEKKQSEASKDNRKQENNKEEMVIESNATNEDGSKVMEEEVQKEMNLENTKKSQEIDESSTSDKQEIKVKSPIRIQGDNKNESGDENKHLETKEQLNEGDIVLDNQSQEGLSDNEKIVKEKNDNFQKIDELEKSNQENEQEQEKQNEQLNKQELISESIDEKQDNEAKEEDTQKQIKNDQCEEEEKISGQELSQENNENEDENSDVECLNKDDNNDQDTDFNRQKHCEQHRLNMKDVLHTHTHNEESMNTNQDNQKENHLQVILTSENTHQELQQNKDLSQNIKTNNHCNSEESLLEYSQLMASSLAQSNSTKKINDTIHSHNIVNNDFKYPENYDGDCQQLHSNIQISCSTPKKEKQSVSKKISEYSAEKQSPPSVSSRELPEILKQQEQQQQLEQQVQITPNKSNNKSDICHKTEEQKQQSVTKCNSLKQTLDNHHQNSQLISSFDEQKGQDIHLVSQNNNMQMEIETTNQEQFQSQHITAMDSVDKARMEFEEEENFFDDLTPISMPEEQAHSTKDIAFDKIPQVRSLILQQQSQQYTSNKSSYQMQQQQQFAQQQYLQQQQAASLSMKTAGKQKTYR